MCFIENVDVKVKRQKITLCTLHGEFSCRTSPTGERRSSKGRCVEMRSLYVCVRNATKGSLIIPGIHCVCISEDAGLFSAFNEQSYYSGGEFPTRSLCQLSN